MKFFPVIRVFFFATGMLSPGEIVLAAVQEIGLGGSLTNEARSSGPEEQVFELGGHWLFPLNRVWFGPELSYTFRRTGDLHVQSWSATGLMKYYFGDYRYKPTGWYGFGGLGIAREGNPEGPARRVQLSRYGIGFSNPLARLVHLDSRLENQTVQSSAGLRDRLGFQMGISVFL